MATLRAVDDRGVAHVRIERKEMVWVKSTGGFRSLDIVSIRLLGAPS